jgi:hypothetical protein
MSDTSTIQMIDMYLEEASAPMFLSGFFRSPPENFHTTQDVEMDIQRDDETVAIVIQDLSLPPNKNESTLYTNKRFTPPIYDEEGAVTAFDMILRQPGQNPFASPSYAANAVRQAFGVYRKCENKIRRAVELMASQVLQTGQLTLINAAGVGVYALNFQPKATHLANAAVTWAESGATGNPLADLTALADVVRRDGKHQPNRLIFGASAFQRFLANVDVQKRIDNRRAELIQVAPVARGQGATFQGWVWIGHYRFEMWTYDGFYRHPQTGVATPFIVTTNVIMMSEGGRLDLTFGALPMIMPPDPRLAAFLPPRISSQGRGLDMTTNAWVTPDNKRVMVSAGTRPLTIPTAIDTFATISAIQA